MALTHADYLGLKYFRGLDGIRALSAFLVIAHHTENRYLSYLDGKSGVSIFFVLSGYLITTLLVREESNRGSVSLKAFYVRRLFRILPIYYVVLGIYCLLIFGLDSNVFASKRQELIDSLPYYIFYMNEYLRNGTGAGFGHSWSLGIEEKFYLLWPVLGFVGITFAKTHRLTFVAVFSVLLLAMNQFAPGYHYLSYYMLLIGCLLAVLLNENNWYDLIKPCTDGLALYALVTVFILTHILKLYYEPFLLLYPIAVAFLIAAVVIGNSRLTNLLDRGGLVFCGQISYGIYLVHILAINAAKYVLNPESGQFIMGLITFIISAMLAICFAYVLNITVERPLIAYGRRLASNIKKQAGNASMY